MEPLPIIVNIDDHENNWRGDDDEKLARRLQAEEDNHLVNVTSSINNSFSNIVTLDDELYAKRLEQEMRDEETARNLQNLELTEPPPGGYVDVIAPPRHGRNRVRSTARKLCNLIVSIVVIFVTVVVILFFATPIFQNAGFGDVVIPDILFGGDDWEGTPDSNDFARWELDPAPNNNGLKLTIQNALTSDWEPYLMVAISDWNGAPALDLHLTKRIAGPDPPCSPVEGIMKVCNNKYGLTGWIGLNEVYFNRRGFITQSIAKMNESYLRNAPAAEKQYVICHEMGHGFGLPHRDENPQNADLGTCLDYSRRPQNNQHPDEVDYENLARLYGEFPNTSVAENKIAEDMKNNVKNSGKKSNNNDGRRVKRSRRKTTQQKDHPIHGRLLQTTQWGAIYEQGNGEDGKIITSILWA
mmetsp:Transcript_10862/g.12440  ORF Transcript_10862/g.12440 Transcript_10862/m.12440 type:complete len:412 (+) Transcript_10862:155-1390(+)